MKKMKMKPPLLLSFIILLFTTASATTTTIGITYNPTIPNLPSPEHVVSILNTHRISAVRILHPTPDAIRAFAYTNISLLLSLPNSVLPSFAVNRSAPAVWITSHVLPFHPRTKISMISVGSDPLIGAESDNSDPSTTLIPAVRNLQLALIDLGIRTVPVSTTFSFTSIMTTAFPPSSSEFLEPVNSLVIRPLLKFLEETNSSFLINLYPYTLYKANYEIPIGFALFQDHAFNFRDDTVTGVRYRNLFDMMVDAVIASLAVSGQENIPIVVAETGWPSEVEAKAAGNYAEIYLNELVAHLRSGLGTPLRKEGVAEAYIYELFDDEGIKNNASDAAPTSAGSANQHWGIMYPNKTMKYNVEFSCSSKSHGNDFLVLCAALMLLGWEMVNLKSDARSINFITARVVFIFTFILASVSTNSAATVSACTLDSMVEVIPAVKTLPPTMFPLPELSPHQSPVAYSAATPYSTFTSSKLVGITFSPRAENVSSSELVAESFVTLKIKSVRLMNPTAEDVRAFAANNISIIVSLPNTFIAEFADEGDGMDACANWLKKTILSLPVELRTWVRIIGVGSESDHFPYHSKSVVLALRNLHDSLSKAGIDFIRVSTSLSTDKILQSFFPPSAGFLTSKINILIRPLLKFLKETDSLLLVNVYPHMFLTKWQSTVGFAVFGEDKLYYLKDSETRIRYTNLYDVLIDGVFRSMEKEGVIDLPIIVAETGWPLIFNDTENFVGMYVKGLIKHVTTRSRASPRKAKFVAGVYFFELFDNRGIDSSPEPGDYFWGLMEVSGGMKYGIDFNGEPPQKSFWKWLKKIWFKYMYTMDIVPHFVGTIYYEVSKAIVIFLVCGCCYRARKKRRAE